MSTYAEMQSKIADDLNRSDLTSQIQREINRAIRKYSRKPFWFNGQKFNFSVVANQQIYDSSDGLPSDIRIIDAVMINQSPNTINTDTGTANTYAIATSPTTTSLSDGDVFTFKAANANTGASVLQVDATASSDITRPNGVALQSGDILANQIVTVVYNSSASDFYLRESGANYYEVTPTLIDVVAKRNVNDNPGLPLQYSWFGSKFYFYPTPDQTYVVDVYYQKYYADLSADSDTNDFTTNPEAEELIEEEAKYNIYRKIILSPEMAQETKISRDEALANCIKVSSALISNKGHIKATSF